MGLIILKFNIDKKTTTNISMIVDIGLDDTAKCPENLNRYGYEKIIFYFVDTK